MSAKRQRDGVSRTRWAAIGAAVAVAVGGGGLLTASASVDSGERDVFVAITPCRVMDTRPAPSTVGGRSTPIGNGEAYSIAVVGAVGNCTIPADASAVVLNVAIVNPSASSFLTVFPAGGVVPVAANVNFVAGQAPVSNAATVDIGAAGQISFYNLRGTVDVTADIAGYYIDHTHDDRYAGADETIVVDGMGFTLFGDAQAGSVNGCFVNINPTTAFSPNGYLGTSLPVGTTVYSARVTMWDQTFGAAYSGGLQLRTVTPTAVASTPLGASFSGGTQINKTVVHTITLAQPVVLTGGQSIALQVNFGSGSFGNGICQLELDVTLP